MLPIRTNVSSNTAQRLLKLNAGDLKTRLERLSSSLRLNRAADDAAGLSISEGFRAELAGANQGIRNAELAANQLRTAEGSLNETSGMLVRMRELAVQASNSTLSDANRQSIQAEFSQLSSEVDRQAARASSAFAEGPVATIQAGGGTTEADRLDVSVPDASTASLGIAGVSVSTVSSAGSAITTIDQAISTITSARGQLGALENRLGSSIRSSENAAENLQASESTIRDADFAAETSALARAQTLTQSNLSALRQANLLPGQVLNLLG